ncbi:glyceraldehyde-3-phosphate dehydrogenase [Celeribacter litoreus]|nr:glyceraldehyde-3-phosphate dehydrogenase [Celeribacter litoreus]MCA0044557.1 glyceraldehyde-3-phosphate dehydrogenase [Celeribacter litoreus]
MTNQIALGLAIVILIVLGLDFGLNEGDGTVFMFRELLDLIDLIAFWR